MKTLIVVASIAVSAHTAHAGAVLSGGQSQSFPTHIEVDGCAIAQVERTTYLLHFPPVSEAGDYVLTVPGPRDAYVVGVDVDRGAGFQPAAMVGEAPPPVLGGSPAAQDPVVSAWLGTEPLRADFTEIEPGPLVVRVRFQRLLRRYQGAVALSVGVERSPLRDLADSGADVTTTFCIGTFRPLASLTVDGDDAQIDQTQTMATIHSQATLDGVEASTLDIRYREESDGIYVRLLTHRTPTSDPLGGTDGYFLLFVDADNAGGDAAMPRTLSLVIDESGSMEGQKIAQAKAAAGAMLDYISPHDRFDIIRFNDQVSSFRGSPVFATESNKDSARQFISSILAGGNTNLNQAIQAGLSGIGAPEPQRFDAMILLSDGLATAGETDRVKIHDNAVSGNHAEARIFTFSVGSDADFPLMEALARSTRGRHFDLNDAQAGVELLERVRELFEDIRYVRLTDLELELRDVGANEILPEVMQDLFSGGQAILVGRYSVPGSGTVHLTGSDGNAPFTHDTAISAPDVAAGHEFIKHVWAIEKVGTLIADMSRGGDLDALEAEITALGLAYRIQTPFTSFSTSSPAGDLGGGGGGGGWGGGGGGGWGGGGANGPIELAVCLALLAYVAWRRRRGLESE